MTAFLRRTYDGGGTTTSLNNAMGEFDTAFNIVSSTGWPGTVPGGSTGYIVVIDRGLITEEKILCSGNSGTAVSVATNGRGYDGTSATAHTATAIVSLCAGAIDLDEANQVTNLMGNMAAGSIPVGAGSGILATPLAIGTTGQVLTVAAGEPAWAGAGSPTMNAASIEGSFTAAGQLYAGTGSASGKQLGKGSAGQLLTVGGADASGLEWAAGPLGNVVAVTSTYAANPGDVVLANASSGAFTITVPNTLNAVVTVIRTDTTYANTITLTGSGTSRFNGGSRSIFLYGFGAGWTFEGDGTNPWIINTIQGQWQNYTPTWTSSGTQPAIGNGTLAGAFFQDGNLLVVQAELVPGSTSTYGSGNYAMSLPIAAAGGETPGNYWGTGQITGTTLYPVQVLASSSTAILYVPTSASVTTNIRMTPTAPITLSTSYLLTFGITYSLV